MESNYAEAYKLLPGKLDQRLKRIQRRSIDWKNLRKEQQNKRRGVIDNNMSPLQEVFDNSNTVSDTTAAVDRKNGKSTLNKRRKEGEDRLALLTEWKKAKEAKKREEAMQKKRPFKICKIQYNDKILSGKTTTGPVPSKSCENSRKKETISKVASDQAKKNTSIDIKRKEDNVPSSSTLAKTKVEKPTRAQPKRTLRKDLKVTGNPRARVSPARRTTRQTAAASRLLAATASSMAKKVKTRGNEHSAVKGRSVNKKQTNVKQKDKQDDEENTGDLTNLDTSKVRNDRGTPEDFTFTAPSNLKSFVFKPLSPTSAFTFLSSNQDSSTLSFFISDEDAGRCSTPRSSESSEKHESDSTTPTGKTSTESRSMQEANRQEEQTVTNNEGECDENPGKPSSSEDDVVKASAGKTPKRPSRQSKTNTSSGSTRSLRRSTRGNPSSVDQPEQAKDETLSVSSDERGRSTRSQRSLRRSVRSSTHNSTMDSISEKVSSDDNFNSSDNVTMVDRLDDTVFVKPEVMPISTIDEHCDEHSDEMETGTDNSTKQQPSLQENEDEKVDWDLTVIGTKAEITSEVSSEDNTGENTLLAVVESEFMDVDQKQDTIIGGGENTVTGSPKLMETEENTQQTSNSPVERVESENSLNNNTIIEEKTQEINRETSEGESNVKESDGTTASRESLDLATFRTPGAPPSSRKRTRRRTVASSKPTSARSPEEWVKILQNSPMVEMRRRTPKEKSPLSDNIVQPLNFDDIEDDIPHVTVMNANKEIPEETHNPTEVNDNTETVEQLQAQSQAPEHSQNHVPEESQKEKDNDQPEETQDNSVNESEKVANNDLKIEEEPHTEEETQTRDVPYFRKLTNTEDSRLSSLGEEWTNYLKQNSHLSEEVQGSIRTVVGQAQLLRDQRFKQFTDLVDNCEFKRGEKETTCQDLSGFWDMIYFQVEDVNKKFKELSERKDANWKVEEKVTKTKKVVKKKAAKSSKPAVKSKFAEFRAQMLKEKQEAKKVSPQLLKTFDAGFFKVNSPIKKSPHFHCEAGTPRKSKALSTSKTFVEKLDCESKECQMEVEHQDNETEETPQNVVTKLDSGEKGNCEVAMETSEVSNSQQEATPKTEMADQKIENNPTQKQDTACEETKPQQEVADKKKPDVVNVEKSSPVRQPLAPLSTGAGELRTPRRKSYAPAIPSPLLHDITPKPKTRRSLAVNTPKQIKSDVDICPLSATPKPKTRRKTITEEESIREPPTVEETTPKSSKKRSTSVAKEDTTPRRRSSRLRKSVCFDETPSKAETVTGTLYEALFLPSAMDSPAENEPADITNSPFSLDSLFNKTDDQPSPKITPKASRRKSLKRLPSDEKRRRSTRRSVHFDKSQEDHTGSGVKLRATPYTRSSRRSKASMEEDILFTPPQKEESTSLRDIKSRPSLLFTPPQKDEENMAVSVDNLMIFTP